MSWPSPAPTGTTRLVPATVVAMLVLSPLTVLSGQVQAVDAPWDQLDAEPVIEGLDGPIDIAVDGNGSVWWNAYYSGNTSRYDPATNNTTVVFHADPIPKGIERGLLGLALDPDVTENGVFYVYYTVVDPDDPDGGTNRLSRISDGDETVLLTVPAYKMHNGGRIEFAPDGTMFVSTGDNDEAEPAQDPNSRLGKILHLHPSGRPANDTIQGYVYSMGHRNVYGLAYDDRYDRLFATENSNAERDEVNLIVPGGNYGWPHCEGTVEYSLSQGGDTDTPCTDDRFLLPIGEFHPNGTVAPTGAAVVDGALYWAAWNQGHIHRMVQEDGEWVDEVVFDAPGRINDLEAAPSGDALYYSNWTGIHRIDLPSWVPEAPPPTQDGPPRGDGSGTGSGTGVDPGGQVPGPGVGLLVLVAALAALHHAGRRPPPNES